MTCDLCSTRSISSGIWSCCYHSIFNQSGGRFTNWLLHSSRDETARNLQSILVNFKLILSTSKQKYGSASYNTKIQTALCKEIGYSSNQKELRRWATWNRYSTRSISHGVSQIGYSDKRGTTIRRFGDSNFAYANQRAIPHKF